ALFEMSERLSQYTGYTDKSDHSVFRTAPHSHKEDFTGSQTASEPESDINVIGWHCEQLNPCTVEVAVAAFRTPSVTDGSRPPSTFNDGGSSTYGNPVIDWPDYRSGTSKAGSIAYTETRSMPDLYFDEYSFNDWPWVWIRVSLVVFIFAGIIALIGVLIGVGILESAKCHPNLQWWQGGVMYHVNPRGFYDSQNQDGVGELKGVANQMQYLSNLGIEIIRLSNLYQRDDDGTPLSFDSVDNVIGRGQDLNEMVSGAHEKGIRVIMDFRPPYTSIEHKWFKQSMVQSDFSGNEYSAYYFWRKQDSYFQPGSDWSYNEYRNAYYRHIPNEPNKALLNFDKVSVRNRMKQALAYWLERGIDGFYFLELENMMFQDQRLNTPKTDWVKLLTIFKEWKAGVDGESDTAKIFVLSSLFLDSVRNSVIKTTVTPDDFLPYIQLIDVPLTLTSIANATYPLVDEINKGLAYHSSKDKPWISFHLEPWTYSPYPAHHPAMVLFLLTLPGTPCLIMGDEVNMTRPVEERMLAWPSGEITNTKPFNENSPDANVTTYSVIINKRKVEYALKTEGYSSLAGYANGFSFPYVTHEILTIKRTFPRKLTYFSALNLQLDYDRKRDFVSITEDVIYILSDSKGLYNGTNQEMREFVLKPGQGIVASFEP
ncbi:unnamed protein product, partial [Owenia fusiformis]